jgi:hypothetical protein
MNLSSVMVYQINVDGIDTPGSFRLKQRIEMPMPLVHA